MIPLYIQALFDYENWETLQSFPLKVKIIVYFTPFGDKSLSRQLVRTGCRTCCWRASVIDISQTKKKMGHFKCYVFGLFLVQDQNKLF